MKKLYPESGVELNPFLAKHYDTIMNIGSFGFYKKFIKKAIKDININPSDKILDLGCGTGRNSRIMKEYINESGEITGLDISEDMKKQFLSKFKNVKNINFKITRIDQPFKLDKEYDKVFISFVIHGFPNEVRETILKNSFDNLKKGGTINILDFTEFDLETIPFLHRKFFTTIECKYAFDWIKRNRKKLLSNHGFKDFKEHFYMKNYASLLQATKS